MQGFRLRDAIGSHLIMLDQDVSTGNRPISADEIARSFSSGFQDVAGLMLPNSAEAFCLSGRR